MKELLDLLYAPQAWYWSLPGTVSMTVLGLIIVAALTVGGLVLARMGYKPLWSLLLCAPPICALALWVLAYKQFPREKLKI